MKKSVLAGVAAAGVSLTAVVFPGAAAAGPTEVTFTIGGGNIAVSSQPNATLTPDAVLDVANGSLGAVTVTDDRRVIGTWRVQVSSTSFSNGQTDIPASAATYSPGLAVPSRGTPVVLPGIPGTLDSQLTAQSATVIGANTVSWNPSLSVALPTDRTAGAYTGTVTHSLG
ncbi:hypothetical protein R4172_04790 [Rhodococcus kroppenstedtii]|uniref:hypothetical protein n=1 Tax=Rhodococcoides kroppenstedtii TaxID=293050 RepID=UPI0029540580|nr:hypothetical protein [Rhodococcus kroppenstedtii]MDV7196877.1 hypothetical protein [Rhodococcus kroppenstedtii]